MSQARWLADDIVDSLSKVPGSLEREQVIALVRDAPRARLSPGVTKAAAATVRAEPGSIERSMGSLVLPQGGTLWVEYPFSARAEGLAEETGPASPEARGAIIASSPDGSGTVAIVSCRRMPWGDIHQGYAVLFWNLDALRVASEDEAAGTPGASDRLLELAAVSVPPGFEGEIEVWQEVEKEDTEKFGKALDLARVEAVSEHLFLLSALLLLGSDAVVLEPTETGTTASRDAPVPVSVELRDVPPPRWAWQATPPGFSVPAFGSQVRWRPVSMPDAA